MQSRHGFTIIELICVLVLIVVLVALLLPSMNRIGGSSLIVKCASNLDQLGLANSSYAQNNDDWIAPWNGFNGFPLGSNSPSSTGYSSPVDSLLGINGPAPTNATAGGAGRLYFGDYLSNTLIAYCPAQPAGRFQARFDSTNKLWRNPDGYTNYDWNPHWRYAVAGEVAGPFDPTANGLQIGAGAQMVAAYEKLSSLPSDKCLAVDMMYNYENMSHTDGKELASTNMLFGDSHVETVQLPPLFISEIRKNPPIWYWPTPGDASGQMVMATALVGQPGYPNNWPVPSGQSGSGSDMLGTNGNGWAGGLSNYVDVIEKLATQSDPTLGYQFIAGSYVIAKYPANDPYGMTSQRSAIQFPGQ